MDLQNFVDGSLVPLVVLRQQRQLWAGLHAVVVLCGLVEAVTDRQRPGKIDLSDHLEL